MSYTKEQALIKLKKGNEEYIDCIKNNTQICKNVRENTALYGQQPYAVILTCSDSRVPAEHIFTAGIGELFVVRSAGNVVDDFHLGSIEFGVKQLGAKVIVVMGHCQCGAVEAAISETEAEGHISCIVEEIRIGIGGISNLAEAENLNIAHSYNKILKSTIITELLKSGEIAVIQAKYDLKTGKVEFFE